MATYTLTKPLEDDVRATLADIAQCTADLGIACCLIGAQARIIWLENIHGASTTRATEDTDFAVNIDTWTRFDELVQALVGNKGWRKDTKQAQRLYSAKDRMVDIIPCGDVSEDGAIHWPPDRSHRMDVRGFELAVAQGVELVVDDDLRISIAPLPVLALLKILAWWDRTLAKDAQDLVTMCRSFIDTVGQSFMDQDRHLDLYEFEDDHEHRSGHLLGRMIRSVADEATLDLAVTIIDDGINENGNQKLVLDGEAAMGAATDDRATRAYDLLSALRRGLGHHP